MRTAPALLPPTWLQRYLALPDTIPQRVRDLAQQVTAGAETRYDQAQAIEDFLRAYTYTLDLPLPPADRDVVDYFLFDLKKGFCSYYASAMVVMARSVGVPARFASGYAQGTYDFEHGRWQVTELNAHSWVEVYSRASAGLNSNRRSGCLRSSGQAVRDQPALPTHRRRRQAPPQPFRGAWSSWPASWLCW